MVRVRVYRIGGDRAMIHDRIGEQKRLRAWINKTMIWAARNGCGMLVEPHNG